jgi:hypothetical protein
MFELSRGEQPARKLAGEAMARWLRWIAAALAFTAPASAADSFADLQAAYHCDVVRRLEQIYATGDPRIDLNRYLVITLPARTHAYVQCQIFDHRKRIHCEASSGFWLTKKGQKRTFYLPPRAVAALARLGFDTDDSAGNFNLDRDVDISANFHPLADLMLRALHDGYDARRDTKLQFNAPFAPATPESCIRMS